MKILVLHSNRGREKYEKDYQRIKDLLDTFSDVERVDMGDGRKVAGEDYYKSVKRAIYQADAVIIENTYESFRLGHEATLAAQNRKPVLVLSQTLNMAEYIKIPHFFGAKYARLTLNEIMEHFLKIARKQTISKRLNLLISEDQNQLLEKMANQSASSKSEILRSLIDSSKAIY